MKEKGKRKKCLGVQLAECTGLVKNCTILIKEITNHRRSK